MIHASVSLPGYQLAEQIYNGSRTLVYRGMRNADEKPVIIKFLRNEYPTFSELVQFRNQYTIAKNLALPGIVKPLALEIYRKGYALVMPDEESVSLQNWKESGRGTFSVSDFLNIGIQLAEILHGLYQNRVIHKDIKPANILIHPVTKKIKLIDFSISSLLPKETQEIQNPNVLEGTLGYISPEQTGRMNRGIDYRSDFYSLGVSFYELLTGELPFQSDDPMKLVHCHIAKMPIALGNREDIPQVLSDIVLKLMAKNAEDRYQSTLGLKYDLERCLKQWQKTGAIERFELGKRDVRDRFLLPEKLYGREAEVAQLLAAFERVSQGQSTVISQQSTVKREQNLSASPLGRLASSEETSEAFRPLRVSASSPAPPASPLPLPQTEGLTPSGSELMLVAGYSGVGKTAVINEVHKPIVRQQGYFIKGKFDQFNRNIPFSAFVQAFRDLMGQLLSESHVQLEQWKDKILSTLGENAQVIIDVIPELKGIIGQQPPVPELSGTAAQNRFNLLLGKFVRVFTTKDHPLVLFLDDLQWADLASFNLLKLLMEDLEGGYLLVLGAYRDNEVFPTHPLMLALEEIEKARVTVRTLTLTPLTQSDLNQLIADTLNCPAQFAQPLTELVYQKTQGNPFFATQFLKVLYQEGLIHVNLQVGNWQCDIAGVKALALTDDVVEFMAGQLQKFPPSTQDVLKLAACIGNPFDLQTLAVVFERGETETATVLWQALQEGLVLPQSDVYKFYQFGESDRQASISPEDAVLQPQAAQAHPSPHYKFLHDRVQQAAYSLIPEEQKKTTHLKIGQLLLQNTDEEDIEEQVFDIVNQLNIGIESIVQQSQRTQLSQLNLIAGRKAKNSTAYETAVDYFTRGRELLEKDSWKTQYDLTLALHAQGMEVEYLSGDVERSEELASLILQEATHQLDIIKVYEIEIQIYITSMQMSKAIDTGLQALSMMGLSLEELQTLSTQDISIPPIETVEQLPEVRDPSQLAKLRILVAITSAALISRPEILFTIVRAQIYLCNRYGYSAIASFSYSWYGALLCTNSQNLEAGYHSGQIALKLLERFDSSDLKCPVYNMVYSFINPWKRPARDVLSPLLEGVQCGLNAGDLVYASYCIENYCAYLFMTGKHLNIVEKKQTQYIDFMRKINNDYAACNISIWKQLNLNLQGQVLQLDRLSGDSFDEGAILPQLQSDGVGWSLFNVYLAKGILLYLLADYEKAIENTALATETALSVGAWMPIATNVFYNSLALLAHYTSIEATQQEQYIDRAIANQAQLKQWSSQAPTNFQHKFDLVEAERYRVLGDKMQAMDLYDRAIAGAKANEYLQEEALANELAAKFHQTWGKEKIAQTYMIEAYYCYTRWGAKAKTDRLEKTYPKLLAPILQLQQPQFDSDATLVWNSVQTVTNQSSSTSFALDFNTALKASQAISEEIQLDRLISTLIQVAIENAGADKGALILLESGDWVVRAIAALTTTVEEDRTADELAFFSCPLEESNEIPRALIRYVSRTEKSLVINDVAADKAFAGDTYFKTQPPRSLMCLPIVRQGRVIGILYLENQKTKGAFTRDRGEVLKLLTAQAAISLENAQLYQKSQEYAQQISQSLEDLQNTQLQLVQNEKMATLGNLVAGVAHEINNPLSFIGGNIGAAKDYIADLFEILQHYQKELPNPSPELEEILENLDLDFIKEDLPKLIASMSVGVGRIRNISTSLRTFSRADSTEKTAFNLHDGIDSTILILKYRLKANEQRPAIEILKDYGKLPEVQCFPGQLNQVFMNLLANAIDAFEELNLGCSYAKIKANPNQITIRTKWVEGSSEVIIRISDNGPGMSEKVQQKVFEHLFTTKGVGKGTGLGLSIARQIVEEKHQGKLICTSERGKGTEFAIYLPL